MRDRTNFLTLEGVTHMPRFAAHLTMMYPEHSFLDRFAAAASDGFTAVDYMFPYDYPAETIAGLLKEHPAFIKMFSAI